VLKIGAPHIPDMPTTEIDTGIGKLSMPMVGYCAMALEIPRLRANRRLRCAPSSIRAIHIAPLIEQEQQDMEKC